MKRILFPLFIGLFLCISCKHTYTMEKDGGAIVKCRITGLESNGENVNTIHAVLTQRLQRVVEGVNPSIHYNEMDSIYTIELPGINNPDIELLFSQGEINIMEMYDIGEIHKTANSALLDSISGIFDSVDNIMLYPSMQPALLSNIQEDKIPVIDSIMEANYSKLNLPDDLEFIWNKFENDRFDLYMLRKSSNNLNINSTFSKSHVQKSSYGKSFEIMINLNEDGAKQFEDLTRLNIGKSVAFCIDDRVLYTPTVNSYIEGGRLVISGRFSEREMNLLNSVLYSPTIKSNIEVLDITIKEKPKR